jgi:hypothetical protein
MTRPPTSARVVVMTEALVNRSGGGRDRVGDSGAHDGDREDGPHPVRALRAVPRVHTATVPPRTVLIESMIVDILTSLDPRRTV